MNVLVANAKSPPGLAVIRSLGRKGIEVTGASDLKNDYPLFSKYCRKRIMLRSNPEMPDKRVDELLHIVKHNHFDVFLPIMSEKLLLALLKRKDEFDQYTNIPFADYKKFEILSNKAEVARLLAENGLPGPKTWLIDHDRMPETILKDLRFPIIVKPVRGEGAEGVRYMAHAADLTTFFDTHFKSTGPVVVQEFIKGSKHAAIFLANRDSEVRRLFVLHAIREYPISGGPTCFLESEKYDPIFEIGAKILKSVGFYGIAEMEFMIDEKDGQPKIYEINPRFYRSIQGAIAAGVDFPLALYRMAMEQDIETDLSYIEGVTCRDLLFEDTKHMISIFRGVKSPKYSLGKMATLLNYLNFFRDDSYFVLSASDPMPAIRKILSQF